jgi:hypothetical protein
MEAGMDAVETGEVTGDGDASILLVAKQPESLAPVGPILRAAGVGFGLGLLLMTALTLFAR